MFCWLDQPRLVKAVERMLVTRARSAKACSGGPGLAQAVLRLGELAPRPGADLRQHLPLHLIADVDIALQHIAAGPGIDLGLEGERRRRRLTATGLRCCVTASTLTPGTKLAWCSAVAMTWRWRL